MKTLVALFGLSCIAAHAASYTNSFDTLLDGTTLSSQFAANGVVFSSPSSAGAPSIYGFFQSPLSRPNYLVGENEGHVDLNPGGEFGNNKLAVPITITFVSPLNPTIPATTDFVSFRDVFANLGSVTRVEVFDRDGALLLTDSRVGQGGSVTSLFALSHVGMHRLTISFGVTGSTSFEDHAGIDDLIYTDVTAVPEPSSGMLGAMLLLGLLGRLLNRRSCGRRENISGWE